MCAAWIRFFGALIFSIFSPAQLLSLLLEVWYVSPVSGFCPVVLDLKLSVSARRCAAQFSKLDAIESEAK